MYTKSLTSGGYISSYLQAMSIDVTPTNCSLLLCMSVHDKYLSIVLMVKHSVSGSSLNFKCTSTNQSTRMPRIFSLMSDCCFMQLLSALWSSSVFKQCVCTSTAQSAQLSALLASLTSHALPFPWKSIESTTLAFHLCIKLLQLLFLVWMSMWSSLMDCYGLSLDGLLMHWLCSGLRSTLVNSTFSEFEKERVKFGLCLLVMSWIPDSLWILWIFLKS